MSQKSLNRYKLLVILLVVALFGSILLRFGLGESEVTNNAQQEVATTGYDLWEIDKPTLPPALNQTGKIGIGAYLGGDETADYARTVAFEQLLGYQLRYKLMFKAWGEDDNAFPAQFFPSIKALELTPIITWEPWERDFNSPASFQSKYSLASIAAGEHDDYIIEWAQAAKLQNYPIIIRFGHEMTSKIGEPSWYPWQGDPANYKKAFQRVVSLFREQGASQVEFLWNPIFYGDIRNADRFYPGDNFVDYVGLTMINLGSIKGVDGTIYNWLDCDFVYNFETGPISKYNKPIIIAEILTTESGGDKAKWFNQCMKNLSGNKKVVGMVFYHSNANLQRWTYQAINWKITTNPETLEKIRTSIARFF